MQVGATPTRAEIIIMHLQFIFIYNFDNSSSRYRSLLQSTREYVDASACGLCRHDNCCTDDILSSLSHDYHLPERRPRVGDYVLAKSPSLDEQRLTLSTRFNRSATLEIPRNSLASLGSHPCCLVSFNTSLSTLSNRNLKPRAAGDTLILERHRHA